MTKKLMIGAAIGALLASGALAQSPTPPPSSSSNPPAAAQQSGGKADFVMSQKPDQWLASKFRGTEVMDADNQKIGAVSDILFDKSGKIEAFVVSVGGMMGIGAKAGAEFRPLRTAAPRHDRFGWRPRQPAGRRISAVEQYTADQPVGGSADSKRRGPDGDRRRGRGFVPAVTYIAFSARHSE